MSWTPIVGKAYSPGADILKYIRANKPTAWKPQFVVLHNTAAPTIAQWHNVSGAQRMANLADFYKNQQHWSAGPHFFVADDGTWAFTPLTSPGVHSPSWNNISIGVEMVGDYDTESFDKGLGLKVQQHAIDTLACLHYVLGLDSSTIKLHKEDPKTTHICPGKNVDKSKVIKAVHDKIVIMKNTNI